jgi:choice-of-anchor B domain-containing protein
MPVLPLLLALLAPTDTTVADTARHSPPAADARLVAFGAAVTLSGTQAFVGEPRGTAPGSVHIYQRTGASWRVTGKVSAPAGSPNDGFGASIAADGVHLLVGRLGLPTAADSARGAVEAFRREANGRWSHVATITASSRARAGFGSAIVVRGDRAMIGAPGEGGGLVYEYRYTNGSWSAVGTIKPDSQSATERFGQANRGALYVYQPEGSSWTQDALVISARGMDNARLGSSILLSGKRIVAGAPGALILPGQGGGSVGLAAVFEYSDVAEIWRERRNFTPYDYAGARFGTSLGATGNELWVGAPGAERGTGRIYTMRQDRDGHWLAMQVLDVPGVEPGSTFASAFALSGDHAVVGMPNDADGAGTVMFLGRTPAGSWTVRGTFFPPSTDKVYAAVKGKELECGSSGKVGEFECGSTALSSFLPISAIGGKRGTQMNDNWGWTDPVTGAEIAILGRTDGTSFVDVTNSANPRYLGDLPKTKGSPPAAWRDMKIYKDHVFIVADNSGEHGMQVFDLTRLRNVRTPQQFTPDVTYDRINSAHNIVANEETGFMYTVGNSGGGETCGGGYHMIDVRTPKKPRFAGCYGDPRTGRAGTGYSHDAQCVTYRGPDTRYTGKEICVGSNETAISIADLTDKKKPVAISRASYPNVAYAHQAWLTDDHKYLYLNDEGDESSGQGEAGKGTRTLVWDLTDLTDPILVKEHVGTSRAIDHNLYVKGDRMYQANYTSGLRILDISDPRNPMEVGFMDTHPGDDGTPSFNGAWSVYPYFKSGTIIVTSIGEGVFFVKDKTRKTVQ